MRKYFYSPIYINLNNDIRSYQLAKFSFCDDDYPHFAETGEGVVINNSNLDDAKIIINKHQDFSDTSSLGNNIDLNSGLLLDSLYEDNDIVIFKIPYKYIWSIKKL